MTYPRNAHFALSEIYIKGLLSNAKKQHRIEIKPRHGGKIIGQGKCRTQAIEKIEPQGFRATQLSAHSFTNPCPFIIGETILIKEKWTYTLGVHNGEKGIFLKYISDGELRFFPESSFPKNWTPPKFTKNTTTINAVKMPKNFVRLCIEITNIRMERLLEITDEDALKEGIEPIHKGDRIIYPNYSNNDIEASEYSPSESLISLWQKLKGVKTTYKNPFVWVIEFDNKEI